MSRAKYLSDAESASGGTVSVGGLVTILDADPLPQCKMCGMENNQHIAGCPRVLNMAKRGYSHDFPVQTSRRVKIEIDRVPPALAISLKAKAKRAGISIRALTLTLWKTWIETQAGVGRA